MIYNYETGAPVEITQEGANEIFPAFYFDSDTVLFFIFPDEDIIYNYTLGVFFKHEGHSEYEEISIRPIISLDEMGALIGYTQADVSQLPTLYYQNGRLTLQHANCRNIGWHPRKAGLNYVYGNILHPNSPKVFKNGEAFNLANFNLAVAAVNAGNFAQSRLIELYYDNQSIIKSRHVSRSQLILGQVPNFVLSEVSRFTAAKDLDPSPF